jgi:hypothetical protein
MNAMPTLPMSAVGELTATSSSLKEHTGVAFAAIADVPVANGMSVAQHETMIAATKTLRMAEYYASTRQRNYDFAHHVRTAKGPWLRQRLGPDMRDSLREPHEIRERKKKYEIDL